jgi:hypothetical protein
VGRIKPPDRGCLDYVIVRYEMAVAFPTNMVYCDLCPFCHTENSGTRFRCTQTGEILPYHNDTWGRMCPFDAELTRQLEEKEREGKIK